MNVLSFQLSSVTESGAPVSNLTRSSLNLDQVVRATSPCSVKEGLVFQSKPREAVAGRDRSAEPLPFLRPAALRAPRSVAGMVAGNWNEASPLRVMVMALL